MSFKDVLTDIPFQPDRNKNKQKKHKEKEVVKVEKEVDSSDIKYIINAIENILIQLNGKSFNKYYTVKVTKGFKVNEFRTMCFRATVINKYNRKVLANFFIEKVNVEEYIFSPPLDLKAFTVNSYESRDSFQKNQEAIR